MIRNALVFLALQNKRIIKNPVFLTAMLLTPLLVLLLSVTSSLDLDIVKISVYTGPDSEAVSTVQKLIRSSDVMSFVITETPEEAKMLAASGQTNAAWVFADDYSKLIQGAFEKDKLPTLVTSYQPEDNPLMMLVMFRLYVLIYPQFMHENLLSFISAVPGSEPVEKAQIEEIWQSNMSDESLFEMRYMDLESVEDDGDSTISAPLRGTLALMLSLIAFAAALFHMHDVNSGVYELVPLRYRNILSMGCIAVPVFDGAILMLLVLIVTGNTGNIGREALNLLLFSINTVLFANIPISLLKSEERYGALIPVLMLMMMVFCPVFLLIRNSNPVRFVLPPYIYLMSGHAWQYTLAGLVMAVALGALDFLFSKVFSSEMGK